MAWIESHQALGNHPKLLKLARAMGWSKSDTLGRLHIFWHWCLDYATDGQLDKHGIPIIADVFDVADVERDKFIEALRESEFVDFEPALRVHDWWDYAGKFLQIRYKHRPAIWKNIKRLYGLRLERTKNKQRTDKDGLRNSKPNQPTLTNQPKPTNQEEAGGVVESVELTDAEKVWRAFPSNDRKVGKGEVRKWFEKHKPPAETVALMLDKLHRLVQSDQWKRNGGSFIPAPMTWLNQKRWEDDVPVVQAGSAIERWAQKGEA